MCAEARPLWCFQAQMGTQGRSSHVSVPLFPHWLILDLGDFTVSSLFSLLRTVLS